MNDKNIYFVSGIDTDAGKSVVTGVLARRWREEGRRVITQKFIQTGNRSMSEDIELHRRLMGIPLQPEDLDGTTCPLIFTYPSSPQLAARFNVMSIPTLMVFKNGQVANTSVGVKPKAAILAML